MHLSQKTKYYKSIENDFVTDGNKKSFKLIQYEPLLDSNLKYYFSHLNNLKILKKNKMINRYNQIVDIKLTKVNNERILNYPIQNYKIKSLPKIKLRSRTLNTQKDNMKSISSEKNKFQFLNNSSNRKNTPYKRKYKTEQIDRQNFVNFIHQKINRI